MAGTFDQYAVGYRELAYVTAETVFGTPVHPAGSDAVKFMTTTLEATQERVNRADKTSFRSYRERMTHRKSGNWGLQSYILPSGTNGVAPDIDLALIAGFGMGATGKKTVASVTTHATTACVAGTLCVTNTAGMAVNDCYGYLNAAGTLEVTFVKAFFSTNYVQVSPPLSAAPAVSTQIYGGILYKMTNVPGSLTMTRVLDNWVDVVVGCVVNDISIEFPSEAEGTLNIGGPAKTAYSSGTSALAAGINTSTTGVQVSTGTAIRFEPNTRMWIDDEAVDVTAVNTTTDVLTITRGVGGTAAASHSAAVEIGPYEPTATYQAGGAVSGTLGEFIIVGASGLNTRAGDVIPITQVSAQIANNVGMRNNQFGSDSATGVTTTGKRDVSFNATMWLTKQFGTFYGKSKRFTNQEVFAQLGNVLGSVAAFKLPQAEFIIPPVPGGGDDEVMVSVSGVGLSSASGNDEFLLAFL